MLSAHSDLGFPASFACRIPISISAHAPIFPIDLPALSRDIPRFMKRGKDLLAAIDRSSMLRERATPRSSG